ncbi:acyl-CoA thioesterase [Halobacteriales archaeon SW_7_71_33]|nr:MAG: acyl-CoA thioesterase [Halobacteriales archaeon SW_7_71_33]
MDAAFSTEVDVRYRDLDAAGHVNNAVYATYVEQARVAYFDRVVGTTLGTGDAALASLSLTFERPVCDPRETVTVTARTTDVGETSVDQRHRLLCAGEGRLCASRTASSRSTASARRPSGDSGGPA